MGATGLVGRCVRLEGGWKPFCEVEWQGVSGWASSCCMAELGEMTPFSYRVTQNLILRSMADKSSWNLLTNYAPNDYIPEGTRFTWKSRPDAGNCAAGSGGEVWCATTASGTTTTPAAATANYAGAETAVPRRGCVRGLSKHPEWPRPNVSRNCGDALGATGLVGRCVRLEGGWKPFCEVEWQGVSGWASSCCMAELGEMTPFSYRVTQNLILRSMADKSSWNLLTNYAPNDYIPEGTRFTWKSRPDAGNCAAGSGGEVWCRLTYTHDGGIRTEGWVSAHFMRSTITGMLLACLFQNPDPDCADDGAR